MCGDCMPQSMCVGVKLKFQFTTGGNWKIGVRNDMQALWKPSVFSLYFLYKPNQKIPLHLNVSRSKQKTFQRWNALSLSKLVWSSFFFCRFNCLFQVEVFEAIQHILTSRARVENSKACRHTKYSNWIQSKRGIKYNCWKSKVGYFIHCMTGRKVKFTWNDQNTNRFLENLKI